MAKNKDKDNKGAMVAPSHVAAFVAAISAGIIDALRGLLGYEASVRGRTDAHRRTDAKQAAQRSILSPARARGAFRAAASARAVERLAREEGIGEWLSRIGRAKAADVTGALARVSDISLGIDAALPLPPKRPAPDTFGAWAVKVLAAVAAGKVSHVKWSSYAKAAVEAATAGGVSAGKARRRLALAIAGARFAAPMRSSGRRPPAVPNRPTKGADVPAPVRSCPGVTEGVHGRSMD